MNMNSCLGFIQMVWHCSHESFRRGPCHRNISRREAGRLVASGLATPLLGLFSDESKAVQQGMANRSKFVSKLFAAEMECGMEEYEKNIAAVKEKLFAQISTSDTVADIGIGTGPNLKFLRPGSTVIGVDPNEFMGPYALQKAQTYGIHLRFITGVCENIPLDDESCDIVITTLTLCSVRDPEAAVREIVRILKPGGKHLFIEHVLAGPSRRWFRLAQNTLNPLQVTLADGCHLNRDTGQVLQRATNGGYSEIHMRTFDLDVGAWKGALNPLRPHIAGYAQKARH